MTKNSMGFIIGVSLLLSACAGEKNEVQADNTILAVRSFETGATSNSSEGTEVAIISGAETPEQAQIAAENATWVPVSQFAQDDELGFKAANSTQQTGGGWGGNNNNNWGGGHHGQRHTPRRVHGHHGQHGNWRPYTSINVNVWQQNTWVQPTYTYVGGNCGAYYVWYNNGCGIPYTGYYNYSWQVRWGYSMTVRPRPHYPRWQHNRRAYVRFYF